MTIQEKLKNMGYDTIPATFYDQIDMWKSWYDGNVKSFHNYRVFNGQNHVNCHRYTLNMGKKVAEDWANLLMNEKVSITLEGEKEQDFFDSVCIANNFDVKANEMQEMTFALGTSAYVIRPDGVSADGKTGTVTGAESIKIDYVTAQNIFPISWENGFVKECVFTSSKTVDGKKYLYINVHRIGFDGKYRIENILMLDKYGNLSYVPLNSIRGFEKVQAIVETGSTKRWFVIDRPNIANNVDFTLPMGIPAFANAIDQLKGVDIAYDSYVNEFVLGKKRIMVKPGAIQNMRGEPVFDPNELYYYVLPEDTTDGSFIQPIDMSLRTQEHSTGIQDMLNSLSSKCGFGENHYRFDSGSIATATQVISENSTMFRTIKKHEIILESVLKELVRIILSIGNSVLRTGLNEEVEISVDFDDSIIENREQEEARIYMMLNAGLMRHDEARSILMNEDIETARSALPQMDELITEKEYEIE